MAPVLRSRDKPVLRVAQIEKSNHPIYDDDHFDDNILLAEEPIIGEPGILTFSYHPYIIVRAGPTLAVAYINAEKWSKKSAYGKLLCSRMSTTCRSKMYRIDYPEEDESIFMYHVEYINNNTYQPHKDSFRGSLRRHIKLYELALKYEVPGLAKLVLTVVADMLVESHPEQMTRACFWATIVDQVFKGTVVGDPMRDIFSGFPLWYSKHGRGRHLQIQFGIVENAFLLLGDLNETSPFYRVSFKIFAENPEFLDEKLSGYFGEGRGVDLSLARIWRDAVEDPLFQSWTDHGKMIEKGGRLNKILTSVDKNYSDSFETLQLADKEDEDEYGGKHKIKSQKKERRKTKKETKKILSKSRSIKMINRMRNKKNLDLSLNMKSAGNVRDKDASTEIRGSCDKGVDFFDDTISSDEVDDDDDATMPVVHAKEIKKEKEVAFALIQLAQGEPHGYRTTRSGEPFITQPSIYDGFGLDGNDDKVNHASSRPTSPVSTHPTPDISDKGKQICPSEGPSDVPFTQIYGVCNEVSEPILEGSEADFTIRRPTAPQNYRLKFTPELPRAPELRQPGLPPMGVALILTDLVLSGFNIPGRNSNAQIQQEDTNGHGTANEIAHETTDETEDCGTFEGLGTEGWTMRNVPEDKTGWVLHLETMAEMMAEMVGDSGVEDMSTLNEYSDKSIALEHWLSKENYYYNNAGDEADVRYECIEERSLCTPSENKLCSNNNACVVLDIEYGASENANWRLMRTPGGSYRGYNVAGVELDIEYEGPGIGDWRLKLPEDWVPCKGTSTRNWNLRRTPGGNFRGYNAAGVELDIEYEGPGIGDWKLKAPGSQYPTHNEAGAGLDIGYDWNLRRTPGNNLYNSDGYEGLRFQELGPTLGDAYQQEFLPGFDNQILEPLYYQGLNVYEDKGLHQEPNSQVWGLETCRTDPKSNTDFFGTNSQYERPYNTEWLTGNTPKYTVESLDRFNKNTQLVSDDDDLRLVRSERRYPSRFEWVNEAWAEGGEYPKSYDAKAGKHEYDLVEEEDRIEEEGLAALQDLECGLKTAKATRKKEGKKVFRIEKARPRESSVLVVKLLRLEENYVIELLKEAYVK